MKSTEKNTRAIKVNTIVMIISIMITLRVQVTPPVTQNIEINNSTVNMNVIEYNEIKQ